jgi:hypothetical protein
MLCPYTKQKYNFNQVCNDLYKKETRSVKPRFIQR